MHSLTKVRRLLALAAIIFLASWSAAEQRYAATGIVVSVDVQNRSMQVSMTEIPGVMSAMMMNLQVPDGASLRSIRRGSSISFVLVVDGNASRAEAVKPRPFDSTDREPSKVSRLRVFEDALGTSTPGLEPGSIVPDFVLVDQLNRAVHFRQFAGKVVALNFVYTRCVLPEYCVRSSNTFGALQKQFRDRLGKDLVLLTVTFDPVHDRPETLREYAGNWKADPENWRFLTGPPPDVKRVCDLFGVSFNPEEGLFVHSVHSVIIGSDGKLVANLEGNEVTARQIADLLQSLLGTAK